MDESQEKELADDLIAIVTHFEVDPKNWTA
jgi:hypothetical protein